MSPLEYKNRIIAAQNQSGVATELTKISLGLDYGNIDDKKILKRFIYFRVNLMRDFEKRYMRIEEKKKNE